MRVRLVRGRENSPRLTLSRELKEIGVNAGDHVLIKVKDGMIIIVKAKIEEVEEWR